MTDEPAVVAEPVVEPVTPAVEPVVTPPAEAQFFGTDGVLNEGWQGTLGEDIREEKSLLSFKSVGDLAKSFVNTKKMVGANVVAIPTDASTEGEWEEYHKAGGRPETAADYDLKMPEGFPEDVAAKLFPEAEVTKWKDRLFKNGVSQKGADNIVKELAEDFLVRIQAKTQAKETEATELSAKLATDWGAAFEQKKHLGNIAMDEAVTSMVNGQSVIDEEFKARLVQKAGNDPDIIRAFANLGEKFAEGKPPGFAAIPTPSVYQDQIDALMEDPLYSNGTKQQRMKIAEKIMTIRKLMKPEPVNT